MLVTAAFLFDFKKLNSREISLTRRSMGFQNQAQISARSKRAARTNAKLICEFGVLCVEAQSFTQLASVPLSRVSINRVQKR